MSAATTRRAIALAVTLATPIAAAQTEDFHAAGPGRVVLRLESTGEPLQVVIERRAETRSRRGEVTVETVGAGNCATPCVLHVPPGVAWLRAEGPRLRATSETFVVPDFDAALRLRAPTRARWNFGIGLVAFGAVSLLALFGLGVASSRSDVELSAGAVVGVSLLGGALLGVGVPLLVSSRTGVESVRPIHAP